MHYLVLLIFLHCIEARMHYSHMRKNRMRRLYLLHLYYIVSTVFTLIFLIEGRMRHNHMRYLVERLHVPLTLQPHLPTWKNHTRCIYF